MVKKILVIDDDVLIHELFQYEIGDHFCIESARTIIEAQEKLKNLEAYDAILIDGCVPGDRLNTLPLIDYIVQHKYDKPLVAISSYSKYRKEMLNAGCTHEAPKKDVTSLLKNILS